MRSRQERRTQRLSGAMLWLSISLTLLAAGAAGLLFTQSVMDLVLIQLVFYGAWAALIGGWAGGILGAAVEEDACGELDMGVTSSMGSFVGAVVTSLVANAAVGLALTRGWLPLWIGALCVTLALALLSRSRLRVSRNSAFNERGSLVEPSGQGDLSGSCSTLRMRDRLTIAVTLSILLMLGLTGFMAVKMRVDLGHSVMIAPMMYAMSGGMLGGILGGWVGGLADLHQGAPEHENSVMVAAMALMSGMMGAMPAAMTGGMMAVMGETCITVTMGSGLALGVITLALVMHRRTTLRVQGAPDSSSTPPCEHCLKG